MEQLTVEEIIGPAESGVTRPYLCRLSDDTLYIVKGRSATFRGLVAEAVCAELGRAFGLPIPQSAIAVVDEPIVQYDVEARLSLGVGPAFGSMRQEGLVEATASAVEEMDASFLRRLFVFDYWIMNEDRTGTSFGGNPNLFLRSASGDPVVIDHNLAFDATFDLQKNLKWHLAREAWLEGRSDLVLPLQFRSEMEAAMKSLSNFYEEVPEQWHDGAPGFFVEINSCLRRFERDEFWEALR